MRPKILFVDDERNVLDAHCRAFRRRAGEFDLQCAISGEEALNIFRHDPADIVVTDLRMPKMQGFELVAAIKQLRPQTECIILTGTGDMQSAINAINEFSVFRYYAKPCNPEILANGIDDAIQSIGANHNADEPLDIGKMALDRLTYGIFVLTGDAKVVFMNNTGAELIDAKDGLTIGRDGLLRADRPPVSDNLHNIVMEVSRSDDEGEVVNAISIERVKNDHPLHCVVQRFSNTGMGETTANVAVFVTDPERDLQIDPRVLAGLFGLTKAESRLLASLVHWGRLKEASDDCSLSLNTARTYLKQIFAKTDTSRQGELIQLVLLSPAVIRTPIGA